MAVPLVNTVLLQSIRLASAATARFSTAKGSADCLPAEHCAEEARDEEVGLHSTSAQPHSGGLNSTVHAVVSVAGDSRFGSKVISDRSRLADVAKVGPRPLSAQAGLLTSFSCESALTSHHFAGCGIET